MILEKYKHPILFYCKATLVPWVFWFSAGFISHIQPYSDQNLKIASVVVFIGLLGPVGISYWLIRSNCILLPITNAMFGENYPAFRLLKDFQSAEICNKLLLFVSVECVNTAERSLSP